jgi:hypothetical protein
MRRGTHAAGTRAAQAALTPAQELELESYLLVDDTDDFATEIRTILRERFPRGGEVLP